MNFSVEQIMQLAPDDASKKAGQQLANTSKWSVMCAHEKAIWGDCQGSGSKPYNTMIDLQNLAFKCSCPSRKFPCKHGLGLFLLYVNQANAFKNEDILAAHVTDWISKRESKAETKETKEVKPIDEKAQQKRIEARERKVDAGIEELQSWLKDTVRTGIMHVPQNPYKFNETIIARMVDAQAAGLAGRLRHINQINFYQEGWQQKLIRQLSSIYFLTDIYKKKSFQKEEWQQEIASQVGWTVTKENVLSTTSHADSWLILSKTMEEEGNISTEKIWLWGSESERFALLLHFYAAGQLPQHIYTAGSTLKGELCFYPSAIPLRAIVKQQDALELSFKQVDGIHSIAHMLDQISIQLSLNPLNTSVPFLLGNMQIVLYNKQWFIKDEDHHVFPLSNSEIECWRTLSISKAGVFNCFAIYEEHALQIHSIWHQTQFYLIR